VQRCGPGHEAATFTATDAAGNLASPGSRIHPFARDHACDCDLQRGQNTGRYGTIGPSSGLATDHVAAPTRWRVLLVAVSPVQNHATVVSTTHGGLVVRHRVVLAEALHRHATA
jgi:hypothetical protein